jgi:CheY-like chemotaxis protein
MARTILLADDSVTIQKVVELTFMDEDFRVVAVGTGTEALERLSEIAPQVVIADVHMPGADGYEVCARSRQLFPAVPVLLLVGTFEVFDAEQAASVGASGHLKKPFDSQELLRRVRELLAAPPPAPPRAAPAPVVAEPLWQPEPEPAAAWEPAPPSLGDWSFESSADTFEAGTAPGLEPEPAALPSIGSPSAPPFTKAAAEPHREATGGNGSPLSEADVDRIARRVVELLGDRVVREVAWEVVPDLAEVLLKARIRELEASVE